MLHDFRRKLSSLSDRWPPDIEAIWNRYQDHSNKAQEAASPIYTEFMKHRVNEQREHGGENGAKESVRCNGTGCIFLERVDEIVQCSLEDSEESEAHAEKANTWCKPKNVDATRPTKDEETGSKEDGSDHHRWKASLWHSFITILHKSPCVEFVVPGEVRRLLSYIVLDLQNIGSASCYGSK